MAGPSALRGAQGEHDRRFQRNDYENIEQQEESNDQKDGSRAGGAAATGLAEGLRVDPLERVQSNESNSSNSEGGDGVGLLGGSSSQYSGNHSYQYAGTESELSLPLYRSRSHSEAAQPIMSQEQRNEQYDSQQHTAQYQQYPPGAAPRLRAVDFQTGQKYDGDPVATGTPAEMQANSNAMHNSKGRHVDFAQSVTNALHENLEKQDMAERQGTIERPALGRTLSDYEQEDDTNAFDDYDWNDDDELVKQLDEHYEEEYRKQQADLAGNHGRRAVIRRFSPVHLAKLLIFTFLGNFILVLLLITPAIIVQFLVKGKTDDTHLQFVCDNIEAWCYWVAFNFIAKWIIHAAFLVIPKIFVWTVELVWGDSNERLLGYVEVFTASQGYIKPLFFAGFFWGSFAIIFNSIFSLRNSSDPAASRAPYTYRVYQVVEMIFFIALVYSIEKLIIRFISLQFHAVAFADRIKDNSFALSTIDKLKDYRPKRKTKLGFPGTPHARGESSGFYFGANHSGTRSGANTPSFGFRSPMTPSLPTTPQIPGVPEPAHSSLLSRLPIPSAFRSSPTTHTTNSIPLEMTTRQPHISKEHSGSPSSRRDVRNDSGNATPITPATPATPAIAENGNSSGRRSSRLFGAKAATATEIARQAIVDPLKTLQNPGLLKASIGLDFASAADGKKLARDLFYAFRADPTRSYLVTSDFNPAFPNQKEAEAAFSVFDKDGNGDISRPEIRHTILAAYKERKFLARSLQDVSQAVGTLDRLFQVAAWVIIALIAFSVFGVNIYSNLTTAYTIALAFAFIFKSAAQTLFDSVIFLFATNPYSTGDRVFLEGDTYVVKQLGLFSTLFVRWDGTETLYANSKLGQLTITNLRRSPPQFENATLQLGWNTTLEQIDLLEAKMNEWLQKDEKRMFAPSTAVVLQRFDFCRSIEVTVGMQHRTNWQDWGERWNRRTAFHAALVHYTKEIGITFVNSAQPVQYWQEDLDNPVPEDDDAEDLDDMRSPLSPTEGANELPAPLPPPQPLMGFVPPEGSKMRRRKAYSKKRNMAGVGA